MNTRTPGYIQKLLKPLHMVKAHQFILIERKILSDTEVLVEVLNTVETIRIILRGRFFEISSSLLQKGYQLGIHYTNFNIARKDQLKNPYSGTLETNFSFNGIGLSVGADIVIGKTIFQPQVAGYGGQSEVRYNLNGNQLANKVSLTSGMSLDFPISIRFGRIILGGTYKYIYIPTVDDTAEKDILNREVGDESIVLLLQSSLLLHVGIRW